MGSHFATLLFFHLFINILIILYVWSDSKRKRMDTGFWIIVILVLGLVGFAIYALKRPAGRSASIQPNSSTSRQNHSTLTSNRTRDFSEKQSFEPISNANFEWKEIGTNYNGDRVVEVSDGEFSGKFVITSENIRPQSAMYERKYRDGWVDDAMAALEGVVD